MNGLAGECERPEDAAAGGGSRLPCISWRGEAIPMLVLGTAQLGLPGYGVANRTDRMEQEHADAIVGAAWECGTRFFDTAQAYGNSEERLGQAFRNLGLGGAAGEPEPRVITKLAPELDCSDGTAIDAALESSRTRVGRDCLWGVMLHRFAWLANWDAGLGDAFRAFRGRGGARYFGVSVYEAAEALAAVDHPDMDIIQIPANAWDSRMIRAGVFERARERGKLLFVRSVFLQGLLLLPTGDAEAMVPGAGRPAAAWAELCRRNGRSSLEMAIAWAAGLGCPLVVGAETPEQPACLAQILTRPISREDVSEMWDRETETVVNPSLWRR